MIAKLEEVQFYQIPRIENAKVNTLPKLASSPTSDFDPTVYLEHLGSPSIVRKDMMKIYAAPYWIYPIKTYLEIEMLPDDWMEAKRIERRNTKFIIFKDKLLRKSIINTEMHPFLQCLRPEEAELVLREIHEGMCGNNAEARTLVHKATRQG